MKTPVDLNLDQALKLPFSIWNIEDYVTTSIYNRLKVFLENSNFAVNGFKVKKFGRSRLTLLAILTSKLLLKK